MAKKSASELTSHLGYWIRYLSNHVSHSFSLKLATYNITVAEWIILRTLYEYSSLPPSDVADKMAVTRGTVTKLADRLIAKDRLVRLAHAYDGRSHSLALTSSARKLVPVLAALADQNDAEFFGDLTQEEHSTLMDILVGVVERRGLTMMPID